MNLLLYRIIEMNFFYINAMRFSTKLSITDGQIYGLNARGIFGVIPHIASGA